MSDARWTLPPELDRVAAEQMRAALAQIINRRLNDPTQQNLLRRMSPPALAAMLAQTIEVEPQWVELRDYVVGSIVRWRTEVVWKWRA